MRTFTKVSLLSLAVLWAAGIAMAADPKVKYRDLPQSGTPAKRGMDYCNVNAFSADGRFVFGSNFQGKCGAKVWDLEQASIYKDLSHALPKGLVDAKFSPDNRQIAALVCTKAKCGPMSIVIIAVESGQKTAEQKLEPFPTWNADEIQKRWDEAAREFPEIKNYSTNILVSGAEKIKDHLGLYFYSGEILSVSANRQSMVLANAGHGMQSVDLRPFPELRSNAAIAIERLDAAIAANPNDISAHLQRGYLLAQSGDLKKALSDSGTGSERVELAENYKRAIVGFTKALEINPNNAQAHLFRGLLGFRLFRLFQEVKWEDVIADLKTAVKLDPKLDNAQIKNMLLFSLKLKTAGETIANDPDNGRAYHDRAITYLSLQRLNEAVLDLANARQFGVPLTKPEAELVKQSLDRAVAEAEQAKAEGNHFGAKTYYSGAAQLDPEHAASWRQLAQQEEQAGNDNITRIEQETTEKTMSYRAGGGWTSVSFSAIANSILDGVNAAGSSGGGSSYTGAGGSSYSPPAGSSGRGSSYSSSQPDYNAIVNQNVEKKLWDMNNPFNK